MNVLESFSLNNKVAIVTGGYGHLGAASTDALAEAGATVYVAGHHKEKFEKRYQNAPNVKYIDIDIESSDSMRECFSKVYETEGHLDILVNNACYLDGQFPEEINDEQLAYSMDGVFGCVYKAMREVLPFMRKSGGGKIINIASMYGVVVPNFEAYEGAQQYQFNPPTYGAAKAAVIQLTKFFAEYGAQWNIRVNAVSPGPFPNPNVQEDTVFIDRLSKRNFMRRIGQPDELKGAVLFLASDASSFVDGQNIQVDGGWTQW